MEPNQQDMCNSPAACSPVYPDLSAEAQSAPAGPVFPSGEALSYQETAPIQYPDANLTSTSEHTDGTASLSNSSTSAVPVAPAVLYNGGQKQPQASFDLPIKVSLEDEIRRCPFKGNSFNDLLQLICQLFNVRAPIRVQYKDEDGDSISVTSTLELQEAIRIQSNAILRLFVSVDSTSERIPQPLSHHQPAQSAVPSPVARDIPSLSAVPSQVPVPPQMVAPSAAPNPAMTLRQLKLQQRAFKCAWKQQKRALKHAPEEQRRAHLEQYKANIKATKCQLKQEMKAVKRVMKDQQKQEQANFCDGKYGARFVDHVNIPDGTPVLAGAAFTKVWRIRNEGSLAWPAEASLFPVGKSQLGNHAPVYLGIKVEPGQVVDLAATLIAPAYNGKFEAHFRMADPSGRKFGPRISVKVHVTGGTRDSDSSDSSSDSSDSDIEVQSLSGKPVSGRKNKHQDSY